jgi:hypothetical protein
LAIAKAFLKKKLIELGIAQGYLLSNWGERGKYTKKKNPPFCPSQPPLSSRVKKKKLSLLSLSDSAL